MNQVLHLNCHIYQRLVLMVIDFPLDILHSRELQYLFLIGTSDFIAPGRSNKVDTWNEVRIMSEMGQLTIWYLATGWLS